MAHASPTTAAHKPSGYTTVSPYLVVDGATGWPPVPSHVHVYTKDVDATYRRALEAGAASVQEPVKKDDADKRGGVKDAGGTTWWIATKVE